ncbi:hypothetical protein ACFCX4_25760 [Kitasatospora sp. NPDC056327]|uniref:hypothetical protein n=1 Tax=Kitasatospora sp. NPDC056327 TaxID=3345785 RepID=UPI0035DD2E56
MDRRARPEEPRRTAATLDGTAHAAPDGRTGTAEAQAHWEWEVSCPEEGEILIGATTYYDKEAARHAAQQHNHGFTPRHHAHIQRAIEDGPPH